MNKMVFAEQQRTSKGISDPAENSMMMGFDAVSRSVVTQKHPTQAAPATKCSTRIPGAVSFDVGQSHFFVQSQALESDSFIMIFTSCLQ